LLDKDRPLSGLKVVANTHVIAGQVVGRTMAEQGAEVLHFARPEYEFDALWTDTAAGMRSAWMDLTQPAFKLKAIELLKDADVFVENYRGRKLGQRSAQASFTRPFEHLAGMVLGANAAALTWMRTAALGSR